MEENNKQRLMEQQLQALQSRVNDHRENLIYDAAKLIEHEKTLDEQGGILADHTKQLEVQSEAVGRHEEAVTSHARQLAAMQARLESEEKKNAALTRAVEKLERERAELSEKLDELTRSGIYADEKSHLADTGDRAPRRCHRALDPSDHGHPVRKKNHLSLTGGFLSFPVNLCVIDIISKKTTIS